MKNFGELFQGYLKDEELLSQLGPGVVQAMRIDSKNRRMELDVAFDKIVKRRVLFDVERKLQKSELNLSFVTIQPHFPEESFSEDYYPELVEELRRRIASLNGTVKDSTARVEGERLTVTLAHGGAEILKSKRFDKELSRLIREEFGKSFQVEFDGVTSIEADSAVYQEHRTIRRVKEERKKVVEEIETYESKNFEGKRKDTAPISIREGDSLYPQVALSSAKVLYGKPIKGQPIPIAKVTPDAGNVTIWGEVFAAEQRETRDGSKKIYSINVTDYTGSQTLKIIEAKNLCKPLDTISKGMCLLIRGEVSYDKYDREVIIRPRCLSTVEKVKVVDDAPVKRVELHLHTNMSSMDGVTPAADLINRAYAWGHKAVAITDTVWPRRSRRHERGQRDPRQGRENKSNLRYRGLFCQRYGAGGQG